MSASQQQTLTQSTDGIDVLAQGSQMHPSISQFKCSEFGCRNNCKNNDPLLCRPHLIEKKYRRCFHENCLVIDPQGYYRPKWVVHIYHEHCNKCGELLYDDDIDERCRSCGYINHLRYYSL